MTRELAALERIATTSSTTLDLLLDATRRPEVNLAGLSRMGLERLLQAIAASVTPLAADESLPAETRAVFTTLVERQGDYLRATIDVRDHLEAMSAGWSCATCGAREAVGAHVSGLRAGLPLIELVCRCGARGRLSREGHEALRGLFGHLISAAWNPLANGFEWDGR